MPKLNASFCSRVNSSTTSDELEAMLDALDIGVKPTTCLTEGGVSASKRVDTELSNVGDLEADADQVQFAWCSKGENTPRFPVCQGAGHNSGAGCAVAPSHQFAGAIAPSQQQPPLVERLRAARKAAKSQSLPQKGWRKTTTAEKVVVALEVSSERSGYAATLKFSPRFAAALCNHGDPTRLFSDAINRSFKERLSGFIIPYGFVFEFSPSGVLHAHGVFIPTSNSPVHLDRIKRAFMAAGGAIKGRSASRQCSFVADHDGGWTGYVMKELSITACKLGTDKVVFLSRELRALAREHLTVARRKAVACKDVAPTQALPRVEESFSDEVIDVKTLPAKSDVISGRRHCDGIDGRNRPKETTSVIRRPGPRDASAGLATVKRRTGRADGQFSRRILAQVFHPDSGGSAVGRRPYRTWAAGAQGRGLHRRDKAGAYASVEGLERTSRWSVNSSADRRASRWYGVFLWRLRRESAHLYRPGDVGLIERFCATPLKQLERHVVLVGRAAVPAEHGCDGAIRSETAS